MTMPQQRRSISLSLPADDRESDRIREIILAHPTDTAEWLRMLIVRGEERLEAEGAIRELLVQQAALTAQVAALTAQVERLGSAPRAASPPLLAAVPADETMVIVGGPEIPALEGLEAFDRLFGE